MEDKFNIAQYLTEMGECFPKKTAIYCQKKLSGRLSEITFSELENLSNQYAITLQNHGISSGSKLVMLLQPGIEFIAAVFAVFKLNSVPILIDPGMGKDNLLKCIEESAPDALIGISKAHWIRLLFKKYFRSVKHNFSIGKLPPLGCIRLDKIKQANTTFEIQKHPITSSAAVLFTTGSTGPPKGVLYTHEIFITQVEIIKEVYGAGPKEIDMPCFPLFALFSAAMGMSCVIPDMDPTRPADVDPQKIINAVTTYNVSFSFGSPALWKTVGEYCTKHHINLPSLKKVLMAGAPVHDTLHHMLLNVMENGETLVPYGATESLPIANFTGEEMLRETAQRTKEGAGYCVGYPTPGQDIRIIKATDEALQNWSDVQELPQGKRGEIVIKGAVVTPKYYKKEQATRLAKITDSDGKLWHRMGDMGYIDEKGRLWFCGRKAHRVITDSKIYYSVCSEAIFNQHKDVFRTALVSISENGTSRPIIIVECLNHKIPNKSEQETIIKELKELGSHYEFTKDIQTFLFHPAFPVDIRHNAKIFREKLAIWAKHKITH